MVIDRHVTSFAAWLSTPAGFLATLFVVAVGLGAGYVLSFDDRWLLVFNLALSIAAILFSGIILVAGAKDTAAIQIKLDGLIKAVDKADDRLIGIDHKSTEELEALREECEAPAL